MSPFFSREHTVILIYMVPCLSKDDGEPIYLHNNRLRRAFVSGRAKGRGLKSAMDPYVHMPTCTVPMSI